jgi:hypothetical protein
MQWYEALLGKPWASVPDPPRSFTCGHLGRWIYLERLAIDTQLIWADPTMLRECVRNLNDLALYDLFPAVGITRPFDVAAMSRNRRTVDHMGIAVLTQEGLKILHCQQGIGVVLDSEAELLGTGFRKIMWYRHKDITEEMAICRA